MQTVNEIRPTKEAAEHDLLKRPGVTAVDIGHKYVGGKKTDELSIRVYVEKKKEKVPKDEVIPPVIEGIKTDVIERKYVLHPLKIPLQQIELHADTGKYDPLRGGISIGPCRAVNGSIYAGTLGVVVTDNATGAPMLLSNFHVMCVDNQWQAGDTMSQPSRLDGGNCPADVIGALQRAVLNEKVDCAVSSSLMRTNACEIIDVGAVSGAASAAVNMLVKKRGRTTGLTTGTIDTVDLTVEIDYGGGLGRVRLTHQIGIMVDISQSSKIGDHGDSGSAVVNESNQVVGLYFAGSEDGASGVANPIQDVLNALDVSICTSMQPSLAQLGATPAAAGAFKPQLKPELIEKETLKAEHKNESKDSKDHKNETKDHKHETKEHKHETKETPKIEFKEAAIEKVRRLEGPEPLVQTSAMAAAGGAIKSQQKDLVDKESFKAEFKDHKAEVKDQKEGKESFKAEFKDELKVEWKEHKNETKEHKNETKEHKNEWKEHQKEHKFEIKEHKPELKETALEKPPRLEGPEPLGQTGAMAVAGMKSQQKDLVDKESFKTELKDHRIEGAGAIIKPQLKAEVKDGKETLKAEWKDHKNETKDHKNESKDSKDHKNETKDHKHETKEHKHETKETPKIEFKEAAIEKVRRLEGPEPLVQTSAMAAAGGAIKSQQKDLVDKESFKAEFKDHKAEVKDQKEGKESFKAEFKDELKVEWKEHKNETKEHKNETKEHKNEWKEHQKEHKFEQKEVALEKSPQVETIPGFQPPFMSHFIPSSLRPDLSMGALGREPTGQQTLSEKLKRQADEAKQAKDNKDAKEMKETDKLNEG